MRIRGILTMWILVLGLAAAMKPVHASEVLFDSTGFVKGQQSFVKSFDINAPGKLTVTLTNIAWPQELSSLNLLLMTASGILGPEMGAGTASFDVTAGNIFAQWFGTAQGALNIGVYAMKIEFQPYAAVVPLPTSIALLLSGLALLMWQRRQRSEFE